MKQPVSRITFRRSRGYLGVYLQEGAPFVDATWNEASDLLASRLRDVIRDTGLEGTEGVELRVDPRFGHDDQIVGLTLHGGPGRFYCGGLPVLWPEDRPLDAQDIDQDPMPEGWLDALKDGEPRTIYLEAWVETVDALDLPDLDDPGLDADRGSFRARVRALARIGPALPEEARGNVRLTVSGAYILEANKLYRVELLARSGVSVGILWDSEGASVTSLVSSPARAFATTVALNDVEGFKRGDYVRFEAPGVSRRLYEVEDRDAVTGTLTLRGHSCEKGPVVLDDYEGESWSDPILELKGSNLPFRRLDRVSGFPRNLTVPGLRQTWCVAAVYHTADTTKLELRSDGLVEALDPWNEARAARLTLPAHPFQSCVEVESRPDWSAGMRVRLPARGENRRQVTVLEFKDTEASKTCKPGEQVVDADEDRTVMQVVRHGATMTLRLDQPLSHEHCEGDAVVPARRIRARRYEGHECEVKVDRVDPTFMPQAHRSDSPYDLGSRCPLTDGSGIALRLSIEGNGALVVVPENGWTFAARAGGWVEAPVFTLPDEVPRGVAPLAEIMWRDGQFTLTDMRPVPAPHAPHGWLVRIVNAAEEIASRPYDAEVTTHALKVARLAGGQRAQRTLIYTLSCLAEGLRRWLDGRPLERLLAGINAVCLPERPTNAELSRIGSALELLLYTSSAPPPRSAPSQPPAPSHEVYAKAPATEPTVHEPIAAPLEGTSTTPHEVTPEMDAAPVAAPEPPEPEELAVEAPPAPPSAAPLPTPLAQVEPIDILSLTTLGILAITSGRGGLPWNSLGAVPSPKRLLKKDREKYQRFAVVVEELLQRTDSFGARALDPSQDRAVLQHELEAAWASRYQITRLPRGILIEDAITFHRNRARLVGGGS